jgi:protein involved in polysaccharide export with SLBB domain
MSPVAPAAAASRTDAVGAPSGDRRSAFRAASAALAIGPAPRWREVRMRRVPASPLASKAGFDPETFSGNDRLGMSMSTRPLPASSRCVHVRRNLWQPRLTRMASRCLLFLLCVAATGCGWKNNSKLVGRDATPVAALAPEQRFAAVPGQIVYALQPGDVVDVKFFYNPELNENSVLRPDGRISLQLVGEVQASDKTPGDLSKELAHAYAAYVRRPEVTVIVRKYGSSKVYVSGEVLNPGPLPLDAKPITALEAIMMSGGFRAGAARTSVVVLRNSGGPQPTFIKLDLQAHLEQRSNEDMVLRPFDIVFVPQIEIAEVAQFFDRYVNSIIPLYKNMGFFFTYSLNNGSTVDVVR